MLRSRAVLHRLDTELTMLTTHREAKKLAKLAAFVDRRAQQGGPVVRLHDPLAHEAAHARVLATVATIVDMLNDEPHDGIHG